MNVVIFMLVVLEMRVTTLHQLASKLLGGGGDRRDGGDSDVLVAVAVAAAAEA